MITCTIIAAAAALSASAAPGLVSDAEADARAAAVLKTLTLEEKVSLLSGAGTMFLNAIPEKGIAREWTFSDNSNSIRADMTRFDWVYSHKDANRRCSRFQARSRPPGTATSRRSTATFSAPRCSSAARTSCWVPA